MLRNGEANPLNVHNLRELEHCPPHFVQVLFDLRSTKKQVTDWIWENFEGRFYCGDWFYVDEYSKCNMRTCAAFEIPGEASMFSLMLDQIQQSDYTTLS